MVPIIVSIGISASVYMYVSNMLGPSDSLSSPYNSVEVEEIEPPTHIGCSKFEYDDEENWIKWEIIDVENGPISLSEVYLVLVNSSYGTIDTSLELTYNDIDEDGEVSYGDTIDVRAPKDEAYLLKMIYYDSGDDIYLSYSHY